MMKKGIRENAKKVKGSFCMEIRDSAKYFAVKATP
mgnify:CR=1 FL=1